MSYGIEACALALLRAKPEIAVPISKLHNALLREVGPETGPEAPLRERLRGRPDLFLVLEPRPAPWTAEEWPEDIRQHYSQALRTAGLDPELRVAPRTPDAGLAPELGLEGILRQLKSSLVDLWDATGDDNDLRELVSDAFGQTELIRDEFDRLSSPEIDRPTTPPQDPP